MNFHGTHLAFKSLITRLSALRNGVDSTTTSDDLLEQIKMARGYLTDALQMQTWSPGNFAVFYEEIGVDVPKSLGKIKSRKQRFAAPKKSPHDEEKGAPTAVVDAHILFITPPTAAPDPEADEFQRELDAMAGG